MKVKLQSATMLKIAMAFAAAALCAVMLPLMAVNFTLAFKSGRQPGTAPDFCGYVPLIAETGSMCSGKSGMPDIKSGDLIIVRKTSGVNYKPGDVVAFYNADGSVTTHRVVRLEADKNGETALRTRGDNAEIAEDLDLVKAEDVIGVYYSKIDGVGGFTAMLKGRGAAAAFVAAPLAAMVGFQLLIWFAAKKIKATRETKAADKPEGSGEDNEQEKCTDAGE